MTAAVNYNVGLRIENECFLANNSITWQTIKDFNKLIQDDDGNFYVLIPKSGCSQIAAFCTRTSPLKNSIHNINWNIIHQKRNTYTSLSEAKSVIAPMTAFIRHPIDRFVSMCNFVHFYRDEPSIPHYKTLSSDNVKHLIDKVLLYCTIINNISNISKIDLHMLSQSRYIKEIVNDKCEMTYYKIEYLKEYFKFPNFCTINTTEQYVKREDLSNCHIEQIKFVFEKDFELYERALNPNEK